MENFDFKTIEQVVESYGWFHFGSEEFECPILSKEKLDYYIKNEKLPDPCDKCYKALIFWEGYFTEENLKNFFKMINSFEVNYRGKLNEGVVVFYFREKNKMLEFLKFLEEKMEELEVRGKTQWRRACKEYQNLKPKLWRNAKEFIPDLS